MARSRDAHGVGLAAFGCRSRSRVGTRRPLSSSLSGVVVAALGAFTASTVACVFVQCSLAPLTAWSESARSPAPVAPLGWRTRRALLTRPREIGRAASAVSGAASGVLEELLRLAAETEDETSAAATAKWEALIARVDKDLAHITAEEVTELKMPGASADGGRKPGVEALSRAISTVVESRMASAKDAIEAIINGDGDASFDVRNVAQNIKDLLKKQDSPMPLFMVLQMNIAQAQQDGKDDKVRALMHIYTVINEELEKKAPKVNGLINRLLRMDNPGIRANLLRHNLTPVEVGAAPSGESDGPALMHAMVTPTRLAKAVADVVRSVDANLRFAGQEADDGRYETVDNIRNIAKEARTVILEIYGEAEMNNFGEALTPAFHDLMVHKQRLEQEAAAATEGVAQTDAT